MTLKTIASITALAGTLVCTAAEMPFIDVLKPDKILVDGVEDSAGRTDLDAIANSDNNYIVKWSGHYGRPATTTFVLDDVTKEKFTLRPDATGLKLVKKKGLHDHRQVVTALEVMHLVTKSLARKRGIFVRSPHPNAVFLPSRVCRVRCLCYNTQT